jgi:S1-C subfamily serine protease
MGIGFAIPSNVAKDITSKLITEGKVVRGWLGVYIQPIDEELGKELKTKHGVAVHAVMEDSPASKAGVQAGDVIIAVDKTKIKDVIQLQRVIAGFKPGQVVRITVISYRDKKRRTVKVKIGELPESEPDIKKTVDRDAEPDKLGVIVADNKKGSGVRIMMVAQGSVAERVGLKEGDIIIRIDGQSVNSVKRYSQLIKSGKRYVSLGVKRKGQSLFFRFSLPE